MHLERDLEHRQICNARVCDSCLNGLEAWYGIQFMPVSALAPYFPISYV